MADGSATGSHERGGTKLVSLALLSIVAAVGLGWGVIKVVEAVEPNGDCGSYGYGGYGCETPFSITVVPDTDLVDRQTVTVSGSGFLPDNYFGAAQCDPSVGPDAGTDACDLSTARTTYTDSGGNVVLDMPVRRIIIVQGNEIDCALSPCTLGAATLDGTTPIQATSVPISFDPAVPAVPRLQIELTVEDVTVSSVTGTVTCNREAEAFADAFLEQQKGRHYANAYGFSNQIACDTTPSEWTFPLQYGFGILTGGPATYEVFASAYDGFESASASVAGETRLAGGSSRTVAGEQPGETVRVEILGASRDGSSITVDLRVTCDRPVPEGYASVEVSQRAGLEEVSGFGSVELGACDGSEEVSVPLTYFSGALVGGPAEVRAYADIFDPEGPDGGFYDFASAVAGVRLGGARLALPSPEPNPGSRITITGATTSSITGTVSCEEPAQVELWGVVQQLRGRSLAEGYGFGFIECDGATPFTMIFSEGDLTSGAAAAYVYAAAYRVDGEDYQYLWDDYQAAELRIRR